MDTGSFQLALNAVSTIGFPSVMCFLMLKYLDRNTQDTSEKMGKLSEAINNNTIVITKLLERCDFTEGKV